MQDHGPVRVLSLNRPPSNPLTLALLEALRHEFSRAQADPSVRSIVLGSSLPKYFSSGLDLDELFSLPESRRGELFRALIGTHRAIAACPKPTVAAVQGYALLGGFILSLACDWRFLAEETGRVALSEIRLGLTPTSALVRQVLALTGRPGLVKELVLKGATLKAKEAFEAGLADRLIPAHGFMESVLKEAEKLAKSPPKAYASVKRAVREAVTGDEDALWNTALEEFEEIFAGEEAKEGLLAMREKRKPRWE